MDKIAFQKVLITNFDTESALVNIFNFSVSINRFKDVKVATIKNENLRMSFESIDFLINIDTHSVVIRDEIRMGVEAMHDTEKSKKESENNK